MEVTRNEEFDVEVDEIDYADLLSFSKSPDIDISTPAKEALSLVKQFPNEPGEVLMKKRPGLWKRLMNEYPIGLYARQMSRFLGDFLFNGGGDYEKRERKYRILELGTGVGATIEKCPALLHEDFWKLDREFSLLLKNRGPGKPILCDFDEFFPKFHESLDIVFATSVIHCANDPIGLFNSVYDNLKPGGIFVIAEGEKYTHDFEFHAMHNFFVKFDGWDVDGGYMTRNAIRLLFGTYSKFQKLEESKLTAGKYDLGGLYIGYK